MTKVLAAVPDPLYNDPLKNIAKIIFTLLDTNKSGDISKREFKKYAEAACMTEKLMEKKIKEIDDNDNGKIEFDEFSQWIASSYQKINF